MNLAAVHASILRSVSAYEQVLQSATEEEFSKTPAEGVWSYAEVFSHIFTSNIGCLKAIEVCADGTAGESRTGINILGRMMLLINRYPPGVKLKVPAKLAKNVVKMNRAEARALLDKFLQRLANGKAQTEKASPAQKVKHPRLGMLNAKQWFAFIDIHTRHHEKQLGRIRKLLSS